MFGTVVLDDAAEPQRNISIAALSLAIISPQAFEIQPAAWKCRSLYDGTGAAAAWRREPVPPALVDSAEAEGQPVGWKRKRKTTDGGPMLRSTGLSVTQRSRAETHSCEESARRIHLPKIGQYGL